MAQRGRPTKLTPELQQRLCLHLSYGATEKMAAEAEGLHEDTFSNWEARHPTFFAAVRQARAVARTEKLRLMHVAACRGSVPAMIWLLERLEPETFGEPPKRVQHSGHLDLSIDVSTLDDHDLDALIAGRAPGAAREGREGA